MFLDFAGVEDRQLDPREAELLWLPKRRVNNWRLFDAFHRVYRRRPGQMGADEPPHPPDRGFLACSLTSFALQELLLEPLDEPVWQGHCSARLLALAT